jgi:hypothetical protein
MVNDFDIDDLDEEEIEELLSRFSTLLEDLAKRSQHALKAIKVGDYVSFDSHIYEVLEKGKDGWLKLTSIKSNKIEEIYLPANIVIKIKNKNFIKILY